MAFRRDKGTAAEAQAWRRFRAASSDLLARSGVPAGLWESRPVWDDLLMHGYVHHHADPLRFHVGGFTPTQWDALVEAVVRYLHAGFPDPGMTPLIGNRVSAAIRPCAARRGRRRRDAPRSRAEQRAPNSQRQSLLQQASQP